MSGGAVRGSNGAGEHAAEAVAERIVVLIVEDVEQSDLRFDDDALWDYMEQLGRPEIPRSMRIKGEDRGNADLSGWGERKRRSTRT